MINSTQIDSTPEFRKLRNSNTPTKLNYFEEVAKGDFFQKLHEEKENEDLNFQIIALEEQTPKCVSFKKKSERAVDTKFKEAKIEPEGLGYIVSLQPIPTPDIIENIPSQSLKRLQPIFTSIEKSISIQDINLHGQMIKSITYINETSPLNGLEINLEFYDTHPRSINIELIGSPQANAVIQKELHYLEALLKKRFESIEFPKIAASLAPIFPTGLSQQKSRNQLSDKKASNGKIVFKPLKSFV